VRRVFLELAELQKAPIAIEAVRRIDALFAIERGINGRTAEQRLAVRAERSRPLVVDLEAWLRRQCARLSAKSKTANAIDYLLKRWAAFTRFLDDGRICLSNNAAEGPCAASRSAGATGPLPSEWEKQRKALLSGAA
jgi:transposase